MSDSPIDFAAAQKQAVDLLAQMGILPPSAEQPGQKPELRMPWYLRLMALIARRFASVMSVPFVLVVVCAVWALARSGVAQPFETVTMWSTVAAACVVFVSAWVCRLVIG